MKYSPFCALLVAALIGGCTSSTNLSNANSDTMNASKMDKNKEVVMAFYEKALTVNNETRPTAVLSPVLTEGYQSTSSSGSKGGAELIGQLEFFWKLIPDLKWEPQEVVNDGDVYIVRSKATGTPNGDFMGLPTDGSKTFEIMTIDMHTVIDGMLISTHHVEDWATAMGQLKGDGGASQEDAQAEETMRVATSFMDSMGKGDMETMVSLMHDDMVWHNEGDKTMPWIGPWKGKQVILEEFMPAFGGNFKTIQWETQDALSAGDTAAFFGRMVGEVPKNNVQTDEFTFALRVKVKDGKVILWNWLEDSFAVSKAYHAGDK